MASLKTFTNQCLGNGTPGSVVRDVFSLRRGLQMEISLRRQMELARGDSFGINAIAVCPDSFTADDWDEMEFAIQGTRNIYDDVGIGIREVEYWEVAASDNPSQCVLGDDDDSDDESRELTNDYTVDNDYLDVFFVRLIPGGTLGWSAVNGPCSKDSLFGFQMSGSVVELVGAPALTTITLAHEVGHYLGLDHNSLTNNFMNASIGTNDTNITSGQGNIVRDKTCFVKEVC